MNMSRTMLAVFLLIAGAIGSSTLVFARGGGGRGGGSRGVSRGGSSMRSASRGSASRSGMRSASRGTGVRSTSRGTLRSSGSKMAGTRGTKTTGMKGAKTGKGAKVGKGAKTGKGTKPTGMKGAKTGKGAKVGKGAKTGKGSKTGKGAKGGKGKGGKGKGGKGKHGKGKHGGRHHHYRGHGHGGYVGPVVIGGLYAPYWDWVLAGAIGIGFGALISSGCDYCEPIPACDVCEDYPGYGAPVGVGAQVAEGATAGPIVEQTVTVEATAGQPAAQAGTEEDYGSWSMTNNTDEDLVVLSIAGKKQYRVHIPQGQTKDVKRNIDDEFVVASPDPSGDTAKPGIMSPFTSDAVDITISRSADGRLVLE